MVGDGPMRAALEAQAAALGIVGGRHLPRQACRIGRCRTSRFSANLLTFPSIREFGGGVVLEAMALGVVPLIVDYAGPGELVTDDLGFKVPIGTRAEIVAGVRARLEEIAADPSGLPGMGARGQARVADAFTWEAKARQVGEVYEWVKRKTTDRPAVL